MSSFQEFTTSRLENTAQLFGARQLRCPQLLISWISIQGPVAYKRIHSKEEEVIKMKNLKQF